MDNEELVETALEAAEEWQRRALEAERELEAEKERFVKFKDKIRDRMIAEAKRRNWCGEFDQIISEFGLKGRFANYDVTFKLPERQMRDYRTYGVRYPNWRLIDDGVVIRALAKDADQATGLTISQIRHTIGNMAEFVKVEEVAVVG